MALEKIKSFFLENVSTRQTVAKNTFWLSVSNFGGRFLRAFIIIYAARILGAEGWGVFSYAISLVAFLTIFVDIGIGPTLSREIAKEPDEEKRMATLSTSFFIKLFLLTIGFLVVMFAAPHFATVAGAKAILPIVAFILIFDALREFGFALTRALERMEVEAGVFLLTNVAIVGFGFLFLHFHPTVKSFSLAYAAGTAIGMIAEFFVIRRYFKTLFSRFTPSRILPILRTAWPIAISSVLGILLTNTDVLMIGIFRSAESVGYYSAAQRILQLIYLVPSILGIAIFPLFSRLANRDDAQMRHAIEQAVSIMFLVAFPIAIGGILVAPELITLLFGAAYLPAVASLQVLLLTLLFDFPAGILNYAAFAYNKQKNLMIYAAIGGGFNVLFDLIFIPRFGIVGSAWATLVAQILSNAYLWISVNRIRPFSVRPYIGKSAL